MHFLDPSGRCPCLFFSYGKEPGLPDSPHSLCMSTTSQTLGKKWILQRVLIAFVFGVELLALRGSTVWIRPRVWLGKNRMLGHKGHKYGKSCSCHLRDGFGRPHSDHSTSGISHISLCMLRMHSCRSACTHTLGSMQEVCQRFSLSVKGTYGILLSQSRK